MRTVVLVKRESCLGRGLPVGKMPWWSRGGFGNGFGWLPICCSMKREIKFCVARSSWKVEAGPFGSFCHFISFINFVSRVVINLVPSHSDFLRCPRGPSRGRTPSTGPVGCPVRGAVAALRALRALPSGDGFSGSSLF